MYVCMSHKITEGTGHASAENNTQKKSLSFLGPKISVQNRP